MIKVNFENDEIELDMTGDDEVNTLNELAMVNAAILVDMAEQTKLPLENVVNALATAFLEYVAHALNEATNSNSANEDDTTDLLN